MRIAVLTGGGDSPGCNAVLYAIVLRAEANGHDVFAAEFGWRGVLEGKFRRITSRELKDLVNIGGTCIGTSRTNPFKTPEGPGKCLDNLQKQGIDALITIGGDDTNGAGFKLFQLGAKVVGLPQTIDNDLSETEYCIGFDSALTTASDALEKLRTTSRSHRRVMVCEIMGRNAGWLTLFSGIAGLADIILIPEVKLDITSLSERVSSIYFKQDYVVIALSEGVIPDNLSHPLVQETEVDEFGHVRLGGVGNWLAQEIEQRTGIETRAIVLGHLQRGGNPSAFEKVMGMLLGVKAVEMCEDGKFGEMAIIKNMKPISIPMEEVFKGVKRVNEDYLHLTQIFM